VPPNQTIEEKCEVDQKFIAEHILEQVGDGEYRSLSGKNFKSIEHELHLVDTSGSGKKVYCSILSTDLFYTSNGLAFKRYMLSNTIDSRFFQEIINAFMPDDGDVNSGPGGI